MSTSTPSSLPTPPSRLVDFNRPWAEILRGLRRARGLSVPELAERSRIDVTTIYKWEKGGHANPTLQNLLGLLTALELESFEQLLGGFLQFPSRALSP